MKQFAIGHMPALDGLRAVSILMVLFGHVRQLIDPRPAGILTGGFLGVDIFFAISGFLITSLLIEERSRTRCISLRNFYYRRALRLLPALITIIAVMCVIGLLLGSLAYVGLDMMRLLSIGGYFMNWNRALEVPTRPWTVGHLWSLSVEEQFYLVWPVLLVLVYRLRSARSWLTALLVAGITISCVWKVYLVLSGASAQRLVFGSDTRAEPILFGCLLASLLHWDGLSWPRAHRKSLLKIALVVGAVMFSISDDRDLSMYLGGFTLFAFATSTVLFDLAVDRSSVLSRFLSLRPLVWAGRRSYGIYLWHWPILKLIHSIVAPSYVFIPVAVGCTFVVAALCYRFIEAPFLKLKSRQTLSQFSPTKVGVRVCLSQEMRPSFLPSPPR